jgi:hypothetical protein
MRGVLVQQRLQIALLGIEKKPENMTDAEWMDIDEWAISSIEAYITNDVLNHVVSCTMAKDMWDKLEAIYLGKSLSNKLFLKKKLFKLKIKEGEDVMKHINIFNALINDLIQIDVQISEEDRALLLLASLPDSYEHFVTTLMFGKSTLKFNEVVQDIISHVTMKKSDNNSTLGFALNVENRGRRSKKSKGRGKSRSRTGRSKSRNPRNPNNFQNQNNSKIVGCWNCGKTGHYKYQCKAPKKDPKNKVEANVACTSGVDDTLICSLESKAESWVLDSGASFHATSSSELFTSYTLGNLGKVYLGDDQPCDVIGKGEVQIKLNGSVWKLKDVRHIPVLRKI